MQLREKSPQKNEIYEVFHKFFILSLYLAHHDLRYLTEQFISSRTLLTIMQQSRRVENLNMEIPISSAPTAPTQHSNSETKNTKQFN